MDQNLLTCFQGQEEYQNLLYVLQTITCGIFQELDIRFLKVMEVIGFNFISLSLYSLWIQGGTFK